MAQYTVIVNSDGSGDGEGYTDVFIHGQVEAIKIVYGGTPDAGTDVTITEHQGLGRTILTRSNTGTNGTFHPRVLVQTNAGVDITGQYEHYYLWHTQLKVAVTDAVISTAAAVTATILTRD